MDVDNGIPRADRVLQNSQEHCVVSATREGRCWAADAHAIIAKGNKSPKLTEFSQNDGSD